MPRASAVARDVDLLLRSAAARLAERTDTAPLEAELLLAHVLGTSRAGLLTRDEVPARARQAFLDLVERRASTAEPVAYLLGHRGFRHLDLVVDRRVLVPRPETELLVEVVLELLAHHRVPPGWLVDLGTGSGAIALSLAREAGRGVVATDLSAGALEVARRNREACLEEGPPRGRVALVRADGLGALRSESVALVAANPPYVAADEVCDLPADVARHEPREALVPPEGVAARYGAIARGAARVLRPGGWLVVELGAGQAGLVGRACLSAGLTPPEIRDDLAGVPRVAVARLP